MLVYAGYCWHGGYADHVKRIAAHSDQGRRPFIWLADFNTGVEEIGCQAWVGEIKAVVARPTEASVSCIHLGGSTLGYVICSLSVAPYIVSAPA